MLHSIVPHHHVDHRGCHDEHVKETELPQNPFSIIFQTQMGEGHLENFFPEVSNDFKSDFVAVLEPSFSLDIPATILLSAPIVFGTKSKVLVSQKSPYYKSLRAPPFLG